MIKSRGLLSFTLILLILLSSASGVFAQGKVTIKFSDIKPNQWYTESVEKLVELNIINGYSDNTFRPNNSVTTAEFLKLSMETAGIKSDYTTSPWHKDLMDKALSLGIITKDLYNKPNDPIARKDVAVILSKLIEKTDLKDEFITERSKEYDRFKYLIYDTTKLSQEYRNSIYKLFEYGLIVGNTNNKDQVFYNPESNLTRAEVSAIVERLIDSSKRLDKYAEYPNRNSVFTEYGDIAERKYGDPIHDMTSTWYITPDVENQRILFNYEKIISDEWPLKADKVYPREYNNDTVLSEKLNPNINKQIFELVKATIDKDKNYFVHINGFDYGSDENRVHYSIAKTELHAINNHDKWSFIFEEKQSYNVKEDYFDSPNKNLSTNSIISFSLGKIWGDFAPDGWVDYFYANKLRASFIALFGEKEGHEIYEYVLNEYVKYRLAGSNESTGHKNVYQTKRIGNMHIDFITGDSATLHFYFSYIK